MTSIANKIFLIKLEPDYQSYKIAPPFGILYLAAALEKAGYPVKLFHCRGTPRNIKRIVDEIIQSSPLLVGFSSLTGEALLPSLAASTELKKRSSIPIVWGGLHATMLPEQTLRNDNIDFIVHGEGEVTLVELAERINRGELLPGSFRDIKGLGHKDRGKIVINPVRPFITNLDAYIPAWHHFDIEDYFYKGRQFYSEFGSSLPGDKIAALITSRGCPSRCGYCYNQFVNKRHFRAHSAEHVIRDVETLKKDHDISAVIFEDDNFFSDRERALKIVREINIPWSATIRADYVAKWGSDFVRTLKENLCVELRIGAESGSQKVLDIMRKDITLSDIRKTSELCRTFDLPALTNFMVGIPGETWEDDLQTFSLMDELEEKGNIVNGPTIFLPYPGTPLYTLAVEKGFVTPRDITEWGKNWGPTQPRTPFVDRRARFAGYYRVLALRKEEKNLKIPYFTRILKRIAKKRWEKRYFLFPLDYYIPRFFLRLLQSLKLKKIARMMYD